MLAGKASLVPKLKSEADDSVARMGEHRRYRRGVYPSGHGYRDGFGLNHGEDLVHRKKFSALKGHGFSRAVNAAK
jgi:hypothetical protein